MRTAVPLLLVALLCLDGAWTLRCHNCTALAETCSNPVECTSQARACFHVESTISGQHKNTTSFVQNFCVRSCMDPVPDQNSNHGTPDLWPQRARFLSFASHQRCCTTDLCNTAPGRGLGAATAGMVLLAPVLAALLGGFL